MKHLFLFFAAGIMSLAALFAEDSANPFFTYTLFWSGSWEDSKTLHNRGEVKINYLPAALTLRGQALDRRPLNAVSVIYSEEEMTQEEAWDTLWGDPEKRITNYTGGLYHKPTGSRLLFGIIDEWGLPARIRNPWIRAAPYAENHKPIIADLKTAASSTRNDEAYLYLSSPVLKLPKDLKLRGFVSAQTEIENYTPTLSGGLDFSFPEKRGLLVETFYTQALLPPTKSGSWFSASPPLPERDFRLSAVGFLYTDPNFQLKTDWAYSETFALGTDVYGSLGLSATPPLPFGSRKRPLTASFAADGGGEKLVYRDRVRHGAGFRVAGKLEWKGQRNSLLRLDTMLRGPGPEDEFNRSSSGIYYRLPARNSGSFPVRLTRIQFSADRNAVNTKKINDGLSGNLGISMPGSLNLNFSGSYKALSSHEGNSAPSPYPKQAGQEFNSADTSCEIVFSPSNFQFKAKLGYSVYAKKDDNWGLSLSGAYRFKNGRLGLKAEVPKLSSLEGEKWIFTVSYRLEKR